MGAVSGAWIEGSAEAVITYTVSDAPDAPVPYTKVTIRPDSAVVTTTRDGWKRVNVSGPNVKKDGATGANRHDITYYSHSTGLATRSVPAWILALADEQRARVDFGPRP